LLTDILRTDFGFNGFVMSDWWAMPGGNGSTPSATLAAQAIAAGLDMELPWNFNFNAIETSVGSSITQTQVDTAVKRILEQKYRFGVDKGNGLKAASTGFSGGSITGNSAHVTLAQTAAQESMVLLKNDNNALPIKSTFTKIAVVGLTQSYCAPVNSSGVATGPGINNCADDINNGTINFATGISGWRCGQQPSQFQFQRRRWPFCGYPSGRRIRRHSDQWQHGGLGPGCGFHRGRGRATPYDEGEEYNGSGDRTTFALDGKMNSGTQNALITAVAALGSPWWLCWKAAVSSTCRG